MVGHALTTEDVYMTQSAEPVRVVAWCRCGKWGLDLRNSDDTDIDEQVAFAFAAHKAGLT